MIKITLKNVKGDFQQKVYDTKRKTNTLSYKELKSAENGTET